MGEGKGMGNTSVLLYVYLQKTQTYTTDLDLFYWALQYWAHKVDVGTKGQKFLRLGLMLYKTSNFFGSTDFKNIFYNPLLDIFLKSIKICPIKQARVVLAVTTYICAEISLFNVT